MKRLQCGSRKFFFSIFASRLVNDTEGSKNTFGWIDDVEKKKRSRVRYFYVVFCLTHFSVPLRNLLPPGTV